MAVDFGADEYGDQSEYVPEPDDDYYGPYDAYMTEVANNRVKESFSCPEYEPLEVMTSCHYCHEPFISNNALHNHIGECRAVADETNVPNKMRVYESNVVSDLDADRRVANIHF
ncbi:uncharacterized protein LDX57_010785 [Aspergillus melleus]|uniref:uncharacterized protein n=1 Tax=Aspergillus melleus TaxID=138277 RepID=UPI001E8E516A|nr:uncharacterized protein LDX57_010785 [Aspergillus melleus]KAH8433151.1 hypothetical protein LDX57_010785 [Aspergillus melleus]